MSRFRHILIKEGESDGLNNLFMAMRGKVELDRYLVECLYYDITQNALEVQTKKNTTQNYITPIEKVIHTGTIIILLDEERIKVELVDDMYRVITDDNIKYFKYFYQGGRGNTVYSWNFNETMKGYVVETFRESEKFSKEDRDNFLCELRWEIDMMDMADARKCYDMFMNE